jgi:hypothetical protein
LFLLAGYSGSVITSEQAQRIEKAATDLKEAQVKDSKAKDQYDQDVRGFQNQLIGMETLVSVIAKNSNNNEWNIALEDIRKKLEAQTKVAATTSPPSPVRLSPGPEPYKDVSDAQLAQWALEVIDKIKGIYVSPYYGDWSKIWFFDLSFRNCCEKDLIDIRDEILRRLGPSGRDEMETFWWSILYRKCALDTMVEGLVKQGANETQAKQLLMSKGVECEHINYTVGNVNHYLPYFQDMVQKLKSRPSR